MRLDPAAQVGTEIRIPKGTESLGRISAQTAKQVILQKVREAERETIYTRILRPRRRAGELHRQARSKVRTLICDLGKTEARLPKKEQSRLESFTVGERVRCVIKSVDKAGKNAGRDRLARRAGAGHAPVRAGSAGDLRQHGRHQGLRPRSRRAHQDRGARAATAMSIASAPASA